MKMLKRSNLVENKPVEEDVPPEVAKFAPKRGDLVPANQYLTDDMIKPKPGDPIRLAQVTAPAVEKIGISTAEHIESLAKDYVEHAKGAAQQLVDDAHRQATEMVRQAEEIATYMQMFATDVRTYSMAKSAQVASFCSVAESVMGSMHSLNQHFTSAHQDELRVAREHPDKEPLKLPEWMNRARREANE